jgi:hypothetical protein
MRSLILGLALLVACSSETAGNGSTPPPPVGGSSSEAGSAGSDATGGTKLGGGGSGAGMPSAQAGSGGVATGGVSSGGGGTGGAAAGNAGGGNAPLAGAPDGGTSAGDGGSSAAGEGGGPAEAGSGGEAGAAPADPCEGVAHWSATERWTDYTKGALRVFGGVLWKAQAPAGCETYPDYRASDGWIKVIDCAGGPVSETAPCQCAAGACCDGCYLRPTSYFCGEVVRTAQCLANNTLDRDYWNLFCAGDDGGACTRWGAHTKYTTGDCPAQTTCTETGDQAACVP